MNIIDTPKNCVGCGACVDVCPTKALQIALNLNGFYEPKIDNEACKDCGKCVQVCPSLNLTTRKSDVNYYYGWNKDEIVRKKSSSGGAFSALAYKIISEGGIVIGAKYSDDFKAVVMSSTEECSLDDLRRSKYCQGYSNGIYTKITNYLNSDKKVMMVGTPCQIAAARRIFKYHENLLLVDFLCGGVTPSTAFANYIEYIEKKYNSKIKSVNMRCKKRGWTKTRIRIEFENGRVYSSRYQFDYYYYYYCTPYMKNEPCLTCLFTQHPDADITIADFWGYKYAGIPKDEKGISFIAAYTEKGKAAIASIKDLFALYALDAKFAQYAYGDKKYSNEQLVERERFLQSVRISSFVEAAKNGYFKHGKIGVLVRIMLRKVVRR
jgi:coenzyme F420-reducing hydrogenase beta subunit